MELFGMSIIMAQRLISLAGALFGIGFLIGFHELGHFLFCKLFGIKTPTFSIGFGPVLFSRKIGTTQFTLSAIPLGGFVEIAGAAEIGQGEQNESESNAPDSFAVKPYYQKFLVMTGGILFNMLFAYSAFIAIAMTGIPQTYLMYPLNANTTIQSVREESPAQKAGLQIGDTLVSINGQSIMNEGKKAIDVIHSLPNKTVPIEIERNGEKITLTATLDEQMNNGKKVGILGGAFAITSLPGLSFTAALQEGIAITNTFIERTIQGYASIFLHGNVKGLGGPLMIMSMNYEAASQGIAILIMFLAIISINLAILNLIPLPILDGGQLLRYTIEAIIRRPLPTKVVEYLHMGTWILMLITIVILSVNDISRIASPYIEEIKHFIGFGR